MVLFSVGVIEQKVPLPPKVLVSLGVSKYFLSGFATLLGLFLDQLGLGAEFHSASNAAILTRDDRTKSATCAENTGFPGECFKLFPVRIRYTTWVISNTIRVMCRI